jgi:hypothetical protein
MGQREVPYLVIREVIFKAARAADVQRRKVVHRLLGEDVDAGLTAPPTGTANAQDRQRLNLERGRS